MKNFLFNYHLVVSRQELGTNLGLFILRLSVGLMMAFSHGLGKLQTYFNADTIQFPDPLGLGADMSLFMAASSEFFVSLLLVLGLMTRLATLPLIFTMLIAVFVIHANDPFQKMEFGLLYLFPYIAILFMGPGKFSLDYLISKKG